MRKFVFAVFLLLACAASAQASTITYWANLTGANESPFNLSPGTGIAVVTIDDVANTMLVDVVFQGLVAGNTASHIHCCTTTPFVGTAGVATSVPTFTGFPTGATSGSYTHLFDMTLASSYNPAFVALHGGSIAASEAFLFAGMGLNETYLNIHSSTFPGGEIRGFLTTNPVPEPATLTLVGLGALAAIRRRAKKARG